ncbi:alcohol dehydrogenase catalytic domain-containing protein [Lachnospiraceae bacterium 54-53]
MKEYVLREPGKIEPAERELPRLQEGEVLVKVNYVGICGSDIHLFHGTYQGPHSYPMLFGHEWSGTVAAVGSHVTTVEIGDPVTGDCSKYCGTCKNCGTDKNLCSHIDKFGITIDGASAEYIIRDQKYLYKGKPGIPEKLLCLSEPVAVAAHLIEKVRHVCQDELTDKNILVLGGGVIGMSAMMLLKNLFGCGNVSLYDLSDHRTEIAKSAGAVIPEGGSLNVKAEEGNYSALYEAARYDIVLETTGVPAVFSNAFHLLRPAGILGCVGMAANVNIPQKQIVTKSLTVTGSIGGTGDFPAAMEFLAGYPREAEKLISHYCKMEEAEQAFAVAGNPDISMKVVLVL